ncbi:siroheme synthase [Candidatus Blochmanniella floridana]|uniref:Siroheme synthase n=1 Tax=Blochmanniella floridana TaxID=203907 RepID=CYSG_BLOFL|nr:RecName: Full=Siroheme synthase; Includes: RecName: Full=Uroporphyrinogen-III C-methyltransferase; Short=Urogen III methylase; AltName: Full=SUMT; AltName: Full=Uroporphyrinogen III methylase; Short=UROM; Includes: RecName: Full=Precorrin-2 dehydrogenase; Includes: RecName: Full=Sirohydrochlorin ferrochelatase [Candidatus Blochmannia floridanus]CAD83682.1 siroheme synthase [Candidatus Blochmannia floridanus]
MRYLPLFVYLNNKPVLVVGGGIVAFRKVQILQKTGAIIQIVAKTLCLNLKTTLFKKKIIWIGKVFQISMLDNVFLVIIATDDTDFNDMVFKYAEKRHILVNTVDDPAKCSFIFPAIIDRSPILIGISSGGQAPVLIRMLKEKLESLIPMSIGYVASLAGIWRNKIKQHITDIVYRRFFWEKLFYNGQISLLVEKGNFRKANRVIKDAVLNQLHNRKQGSVSLVGAGPGDKGLLTIRGLQVIQTADIILYDYLVNPDILDLSRKDANKICVGKIAKKHSISQNNLNHFMIQLAQQGNNVVRLKGGDSFIFGRGGEELQAVSKAGIMFQVVPGITSGIGVAAYAGIPLTHREYAHSVVFMTGHKRHQGDYKINWSLLSDNKQTIVIYMGQLNAVNISKNLICHGRHIYTPVAIISRGTYLDQKILIGTLIELEKLIYMVKKPTLLIIGDVVSLHNEISWFGNG